MDNTVSDEILTAYLDGELDDAQRRDVDIRLAADAGLAARLRALDVSRAQIKAGFDALLTQAPDLPDTTAQGGRGLVAASVAVAALFLLGIGLGAFWSPRAGQNVLDDWKMAVANYQALYVTETLSAPTAPPEQARQRLSDLSQSLGRDLAQASQAPGLAFKRAQMLGLHGEPLVQVAYLTDDNIPVAFCITPVDGPAQPLRSETLAGLAAAHWVADGYGFLLIGGDDLDQITDIATDLKTRI